MSSTKFCSEEKIWRGPSKPAWLFNEKANLGRILLSILNRNPQKVAQISDNNGIRMTNREIASDAEKIAGGLKQRGCRTGDVVGIVARNGHNITPTLIACFLLETPSNTMDVIPSEDEVYAMFNITKPKFIFCDDDKIPLVVNVIERLQSSATIISFGVKQPNQLHIEDLMREGDSEDLRREIYVESCGDIKINYQFIVGSSGTSGPQKAVAVPYQTLLDAHWPTKMSSSPSDCFFSFCSISWTVFYLILFQCIFHGWIQIITTETFTPDLFLHIVNKYKVNFTNISSVFLDQVLATSTITPTSFKSLKNIWSAGNLISEDFVRKLLPYVPNTEFQIAYGMSEVGVISTYIYDKNRTISVGNIEPGVEGIVINEEGYRLGSGETGQLCFKTPYYLTEYIGNEAATRNLFSSEGFMFTGDLGFYDDEGFLHIVGRCKELLKFLNLHVSASEIERLIQSLQGVANAVVVGVKDSWYNQLPAAVVTKEKGAQIAVEEISDLVAKKLPDSHQLRGGVYFLDKLPTTVTGKFKKYEIEKYAEEMFNLSKKGK